MSADKVAHFCSMCRPKFCSMKITAEYGASLGDKEKKPLDVVEISEKLGR